MAVSQIKMLRDKHLSQEEYTANLDFILAAMMYEDDEKVPGVCDVVRLSLAHP